MAKKRGIYTIVQYYNHPVTGETLFDDDILSTIRNRKCIKKCACIVHDRDTYKQSDIDKQKERLKKAYMEKQNEFVDPETGTVSISCDAYIEQEMATTYSYIQIGAVKPKHIHIVINTGKSAIDTADLSLWFGVPENLVDIVPKGRGNRAWYDCIRYLTHETPQAIKDGKYRYAHDEVFVFGEEALDYDEELAEYERLMEEYGKVLTPEEAMEVDVLQGRKTPEQCSKKDPVLYAKLRDKLIKLHGDYLQTLPQPNYRLNFYVDGQGGEGKWQFIMALARSMFPDIGNDDDLYFKVGAENVTFEGYHGQPVIVWDDCRSGELVRKLGGRGNVFEVFNTFPERGSKLRQHVKFSYTNLVNKVNIVNSAESWDEFLDGLAGEYTDYNGHYHEAEDKKQSYRRFPMIVCLHQEDYEVLLNKGFLNGTREYLQYTAYRHIRGSFFQIADICKQNEDLKRELAMRAVRPAIDKVRLLEAHVSTQQLSEEEIREMFRDYGTYDFAKLQAEAEAENRAWDEARIPKETREELEARRAEEAEKAQKKSVCDCRIEIATRDYQDAYLERESGMRLMFDLKVDSETFKLKMNSLEDKFIKAHKTLALAMWRRMYLYVGDEMPTTDWEKEQYSECYKQSKDMCDVLFSIV